MLPLGRNKVSGPIKQGGGPDSACGPCVCHLWSTQCRAHTPPAEQSSQTQEPPAGHVFAGERNGDTNGGLFKRFSAATRHAGSLGPIPLKPAG